MANTKPTIEATKDFIVIKIPKNIFTGKSSHKEALNEGIEVSLKESRAGKLYGPFGDAHSLLKSLKK